MSVMYLSIESNLNDRYANLQRAIAALQKHFTITALSPVYLT